MDRGLPHYILWRIDAVLWGNIILNQFILGGHTGGFQAFALLNIVKINILVHTSFCIFERYLHVDY